MAIKLTFAALCEDVRLEIGGRITIVGAFDILALPVFPGGANLCVTTRWSGNGPDKAAVALKMLTPDNPAPIHLLEQPIELKDQEGLGFCSAGTVAKFTWQFHAPGVHYIQIRLDDEERGQIPFMVRKHPHPEKLQPR
ncbi:MAG: DUF6941 family protein [Patescibacteria group bacterium]